jgi:hypothetical protein
MREEMIKIFAWLFFACGGFIVFLNALISIKHAKNKFSDINLHGSFLPILDAIFFAVGIFILYFKILSFILFIAIFVGGIFFFQLCYFLVYKIALAIMRLNHKTQ